MALFGRRRVGDARKGKLWPLTAARARLEEAGIRPGGAAAVCFKPPSSAEYVRAENELQEVLEAAATASGSRIRRRSDEYGYEWLVAENADLEELVRTVHVLGGELAARGFGKQLLAAIFRFEDRGRERPVFWIYGYKREVFWPFVPAGEGQERDNEQELELKRLVERELPVEQDLSRWFAMFDSPLESPL